MYITFLFFLTPIIVLPLLVILASLLTKKFKEDLEKSSPFECGFDPLCSSRSTLTVRFYLMAIIFLIFDVEIVLIMPMILIKFISDPTMWILTFSTFIIILIMGLFYEWNEGTFNWSQ